MPSSPVKPSQIGTPLTQRAAAERRQRDRYDRTSRPGRNWGATFAFFFMALGPAYYFSAPMLAREFSNSSPPKPWPNFTPIGLILWVVFFGLIFATFAITGAIKNSARATDRPHSGD